MRQNMKVRSDSVTGYRGVSHKDGHYYARIVGINLGVFESAEEAAQAVDDFLIRRHLGGLLNNVSANVLNRIAWKRNEVLAAKSREHMMQRPKIRAGTGRESQLQDDIMRYMQIRGWFVKHLHGNMYQHGLPDLIAFKKIKDDLYGGFRMIELKVAEKYSFTPAQQISFKEMTAHGARIWILTAATDHEYAKLFQPPNWYHFLTVMK